MLYAEDDPDETVYLWFWADIGDGVVRYPQGAWTMKILIDGSYILEDRYQVNRSFTYGKNALMR